jgi:hypothetical protein
MAEHDGLEAEVDRATRRLLCAAGRLTSSAFDEQSRRHLRPIAEWSATAFEAASHESTTRRIASALTRPELVDLDLPSPVQGLVAELDAISIAIETWLDPAASNRPERGLAAPQQPATTRRRNAERKDLLNALQTVLGSILDALGTAFPILHGLLKAVQEVVDVARG